MKPELSVFLLAYNEEGSIRSVVYSCVSVLSELAGAFEVIVVLYEGSTDDTRSIVEDMGSKDSRVRLVIQPKDDPGYGAAMQLGYKSAKYPLIFYTDADDQFYVSELAKLLAQIDDAELVVGYRVDRKDPLGRIVAAKVYNLLIRIVFGLRVRDVDCAFKLVRKDVFVKFEILSNTGLSDAELLIKAKKAGFRIVEVPVSHRPRMVGKAVFHGGGLGFPKLSVVLNLARDISKLKMEVSSLK
ncbi:MAG: glycosyltransferase family 2 protein [Candidatus Altiarchaeota archaeon]